MRNIAIVEDEDLAAQALIDHIKQYEAQTGQSFQIFRFANGADFLQDYRAVYAVVFLDVQMPRMNGLETALQLRRCDKNVSIIFITNLVQYALKGYEVDAVSYLIKPVSY